MTVDAAAPKKSSGRVVPQTLKWHGELAALAIYGAAKFINGATRVRPSFEPGALENVPGPVIFAVWHNRLALCMAAWREARKKLGPQSRLAALISASKDGALLARVLERFDVQPVRGSSSRRGPQALIELTSLIEKGYSVAITPDGPRGPKYAVQDGVVSLASVTQVPIIPATIHTHRKWELKSWDNFQIPVPFTAAEIRFHPRITVPRNVSDSERIRLREQLREALSTPLSD